MNNELYHYGVIGMKWGVRRYQSTNETRTSEGKKKEKKQFKLSDKQKRILTNTAKAVGIGLAAYQAYKLIKVSDTTSKVASYTKKYANGFPSFNQKMGVPSIKGNTFSMSDYTISELMKLDMA